jgi:hypothetical protein
LREEAKDAEAALIGKQAESGKESGHKKILSINHDSMIGSFLE